MNNSTPDLIRAYQDRERFEETMNRLYGPTSDEPADGEVFAGLATIGIIVLVFFYFLCGGGW